MKDKEILNKMDYKVLNQTTHKQIKKLEIDYFQNSGLTDNNLNNKIPKELYHW